MTELLPEQESHKVQFYIVNDCDEPTEKMITEKRKDGKFYYLHPTMSGKKEFHGMTPSDPTPLEDFGIVGCVIDAVFRAYKSKESTATYSDGKNRKWQGIELFTFPLWN